MKTDCNTISCTSRYCGQALGYCAEDACDKSSSGRALGGVSLDNQSTGIFAILQTSLAAKAREASMGAAYFIWRVNGYCYYVACGNCRVIGVQHTSPKSRGGLVTLFDSYYDDGVIAAFGVQHTSPKSGGGLVTLFDSWMPL